MITKIQEQLTALDKKVDSLINKSVPQQNAMRPPAPRPSFQPPINAPVQQSARPNGPHKGRPMYRAICADCKKECELPFKPSGNRPVYCKECFSRRRASNTFKPVLENRPKETPPVQAVIPAVMNIPALPVKEKKKPASAKKPVGKKKPVTKKKKK